MFGGVLTLLVVQWVYASQAFDSRQFDAFPRFYSRASHSELDILPGGGSRLLFGRHPTNGTLMRGQQLIEKVLIRYSLFHARTCRHKIDVDTIIYRCSAKRSCAGYSDRIRSIFGPLKLAMILGRCFFLEMSSPKGMMDVLVPNAIDWQIPAGLILPNDYHRWGSVNWQGQPGEPARIIHMLNESKPLPRHMIIETNEMIQFRQFLPYGTLVRSEAENQRNGFRTSQSELFRINNAEAMALDNLAIQHTQAVTHTYLFKTKTPGRLLASQQMLRAAKFWGGRLVSLHVRTGDTVFKTTKSDSGLANVNQYLQSLIDPIVKASERCGGMSLYVASDSVDIVGRILAMLPDHVQGLHCCGRAYHVDFMSWKDGLGQKTSKQFTGTL